MIRRRAAEGLTEVRGKERQDSRERLSNWVLQNTSTPQSES